MRVTRLHLHKISGVLDIQFANQKEYSLTAEFLRVHSPSAEVKGHGNPILVTNKRDVKISDLALIGNYAVKLSFNDGHNSGLYSWETLYQYATQQKQMWADYLESLAASNAGRESVIPIKLK